MTAVIQENFQEVPASSDCSSIGPVKALILDDSSFDRRRLMRECADIDLDITFVEVATLRDLKAKLDSDQFDLVFIDYRLNDGDGLKALETINLHPKHITCATIMVTGQGDSSVAVDAMRLGASDYIEKSSFSPQFIHKAITNALQKSHMQRDISSAMGLNSEMKRMMDRFVEDCVTDMKPVLSRMMRQIRSKRAKTATYGALNDVDELDATCASLWDYLEKMEAYSKSVHL